jgi:predicted HTH domain antitoxin
MVTHDLVISYPAELLDSLSEAQLQQPAREAFYVRLYEQGLISSGRAGAQLGMTRSDFLDLLGKYGVSYFAPQTDLAADARNIDAARNY